MVGSRSSWTRGGQDRLRVLLFTNSVQMGGMEEHVRMLAEQLPRERFEVEAIVPDEEATVAFTTQMRSAADHLEQLTLDERHGVPRRIRDVLGLMRYGRSRRIDVAHLHSTAYRGVIAAWLALRAGGVRRIYVTEHLAPDGPVPIVPRTLRNAFSRAVTGIVCVSPKNFRARAEWLTTPPESTVVVVNGIDLDRFEAIPPEQTAQLRCELGIHAGAPVVGAAVRFEPEKGLDDLIEAMALVHTRHPDAILLMVGDGSLRDELTAQAERLGIADVTRFVGFQKDTRPFYALMDVFVLPVPFGSASIGLLEAMAMRLAPVMTFGGEGEAVIHGETGFCAEPNDPTSIAEYVNLLLDDDELRERISAAARRIVETDFSSRRVADTLSILYQHGPSALPLPS